MSTYTQTVQEQQEIQQEKSDDSDVSPKEDYARKGNNRPSNTQSNYNPNDRLYGQSEEDGFFQNRDSYMTDQFSPNAIDETNMMHMDQSLDQNRRRIQDQHFMAAPVPSNLIDETNMMHIDQSLYQNRRRIQDQHFMAAQVPSNLREKRPSKNKRAQVDTFEPDYTSFNENLSFESESIDTRRKAEKRPSKNKRAQVDTFEPDYTYFNENLSFESDSIETSSGTDDSSIYGNIVFQEEEDEKEEKGIFDDVVVRPGYKMQGLRNNCIIIVPSKAAAEIAKLKTKPWNMIKRSQNMPDTSKREDEIFCTNVFDLVYENEDIVSHLGRRRSGLNIPSEFTIGVLLKGLTKPDFYTFEAVIKTEGCWKRKSAKRKENSKYVTFETNTVTIQSFCIIATPIVVEREIGPNGFSYVSKEDSQVCVEFPKDCVKRPEQMQFTLLPVDKEMIRWRRENCVESQTNIMAMSDVLLAQHNVAKFHKPVQVTLPIHDQVDGCDLVFFRWNNDTFQVIDSSSNSTLKKVGECATIEVTGFSRYAAAMVRRVPRLTISRIEAEVCCGKKRVCNILLFLKKGRNRRLTLWLELARQTEEREIRNERESYGLTELRSCRSPDIYIKNGDRIRISMKGCLQYEKSYPKSYLLIQYFDFSARHFATFPANIYEKLDKNPFGIIEITSDTVPKGILHMAHFDPLEIPTKPVVFPSNPSLHSSNPSLHSKENEFEFFSEKNMLKLAKNLDMETAYEVGINLGLQTIDIANIKATSQGIVMENMKILISGLTKVKDKNDRFSHLVNALRDADMIQYADAVTNAFNEKRLFKDSDFK